MYVCVDIIKVFMRSLRNLLYGYHSLTSTGILLPVGWEQPGKKVALLFYKLDGYSLTLFFNGDDGTGPK